jgi:hypothetical protein
MMPAIDGLPGVGDTEIDGFIRAYFREMNILSTSGLVLGTLLFVLAPVVTIGVPLPSFLLPAKWLDAYADRVVAHPVYLIRQGISVLKMVAGLCWGADPAVRRRLNLQPYPADPGTWLHE